MNTTISGQPAAPGAPVSEARECLSFRLGDEEYGIDILRVQEIRGYEVPTHIVGAPKYVRGVLNLRGTIVPVVDLRLRFGMEARFDASTVTVVLNVGGRTVGAVVDSVSDVLQLSPAQIKPAPAFSDDVNTDYINGLGTIDQGGTHRMLILMDIERLMGGIDVGHSAAAH